MPEEVMDRSTGAIIFKKTSEEKAALRADKTVKELAPKVDYIYRFLRRYEPVFEEMMSRYEK